MRERKRTRANEGKGRKKRETGDARRGGRRERGEGGRRDVEIEESKIVKRRRGMGVHGEPAASRFTKVRCFFPVSMLLLPESRDVSPSLPPSHPFSLYSSTAPLVPLSSVLVVRASWCPPVSPYTHSSSLLSYLPLPPSARVIPFSILPSFMFFRALSHLSAVSTSISKKSSRELFVGKCREPAVLRARAEIEVRKANEIKKNDVEERKKV